MASQITCISIVCSTVCSGADQRKRQSSASLAFVRGIHRLPVNSPHKGPVMRKMFPFDDVIMVKTWCRTAIALLTDYGNGIECIGTLFRITKSPYCDISQEQPGDHFYWHVLTLIPACVIKCEMKLLINSKPHSRWSLGMNKSFQPTLYYGCNYLSTLKLIHVNIRGSWSYLISLWNVVGVTPALQTKFHSGTKALTLQDKISDRCLIDSRSRVYAISKEI